MLTVYEETVKPANKTYNNQCNNGKPRCTTGKDKKMFSEWERSYINGYLRINYKDWNGPMDLWRWWYSNYKKTPIGYHKRSENQIQFKILNLD